MTAKNAKLVHVAQDQQGLSKGQVKFNRLIAEIAQQRRRLADWQAIMPDYRRVHDGELRPLLATLDAGQAKLAVLLDSIADNKKFGQRDRRKISDIIIFLAAGLLRESSDATLKQLYNRHSGSDYDAEEADECAAMKGMMEEVLGHAVDDDIDPVLLMQQFAAKMAAEQAREQQRIDKKAQRRAGREKSARSAVQEERRAQEASQVSQSIREVFRKLASALHPDRAPEGAERDRMTALMQRVNVAYGNKDLLALLELQLEVEQIDQAGINGLSAERLTHYNKVLSGQIAELHAEVSAAEFEFRMEFDPAGSGPVTPAVAMQALRQQIAVLRDEITCLNLDLQRLPDTTYAKRWLKDYAFPADAMDEWDDNMGVELDRMLFGRGY